MKPFDEGRFRSRVDGLLTRLKTIMTNNRTPQYPSDVFHQYDDKYMLVEFLGNSGLAGQINCLKTLGMDDKAFETLREWAKTRSVHCFKFFWLTL